MSKRIRKDIRDMPLQEAKRKLESEGYVDRLELQSEVNEAWWDRFSERFTIRTQEPLGVDIPESVLELFPFHVFIAISENSTSVTTREFDSTGRAYGLIVKTVNWPDVCADLALLAYKSKR